MFNSSSRRRELALQTAQREEAEQAARTQLGHLYGEIGRLFRELPSVTGPRVVVGIGPKGGSGKTTTMTATSYLLSELTTGDLYLADNNPDKSNLRERLVRAGRRGTLLDLIGALGTLHYPSQLARFVVPVHRIKLIHKDGLRSVDVQQVPASTWYELLETLSWYGQLVLADGGLSLVSPAAQGSLARADHVVLAVEADPVVVQKTLEAVNEIMTADPAIRELLLGATVVVTYTNPTADLDPLLAESIEYLQRTFSGVFVVPYDPAAAVSGMVPFDRLATATHDAYLRVALHVAECFLRPPRATTAPTKAHEDAVPAPTDRPVGTGAHHSVGAAPAEDEGRHAPALRLDPVQINHLELNSADPVGTPAR